MPTFSAIQLDQLLEPKTTSFSDNIKLERRKTTSFHLDDRNLIPSRASVDIPPPHPNSRHRRSNSDSIPPHFNDNNVAKINEINKVNEISSRNVRVRPQMSPALYTTPESMPLPDSPTLSFPPSSPFLINHKRRGPRLAKSLSDKFVVSAVNGGVVVEEELGLGLGRTRSLLEENGTVDGNVGEVEKTVNGGEVVEKTGVGVGEGEVKARTGGEGDDVLGEFYDASEDLSSDSGLQGAQRSLSEIETELRELRLTLLMEIEKRRHAEEAAQNMQNQWQVLREKLRDAGLVLPAALAVLEDSQSDVSPIEDICRQLYLARFVSESVGRGTGRAEVDSEMESQLEAKNFEIARLCDRLHYYETMNREMSQMNQEAVEIARQDRHKRRRRQKWVWGSIATAITLGSAALAWSYLPSGEASSSTKYLEASERDSDMQ